MSNNTGAESVEMHALIKGQVQGVGFRASTCLYALHLGLKGTVRNLADGRVEIYAQGSKKNLEELIRQLKEETRLAQVKEVSTRYIPIQQTYTDFRIIH